MTCGACVPEAFRERKGMRIWGYITAPEMHDATMQACKLHFVGAENVVSDRPDIPLVERPGWKILSDPALLRRGDRLILSRQDDLGSDPEQARPHYDALAARGVEVCILKLDSPDDEP